MIGYSAGPYAGHYYGQNPKGGTLDQKNTYELAPNEYIFKIIEKITAPADAIKNR